jgi:hypothetical protein
MPGLPVVTLPPACPFSNIREIPLLACYKAAYRARRQLMHNREITSRFVDILSVCPRNFRELPATGRTAIRSQLKSPESGGSETRRG